jgi:hypothetical protein
MSDFSAGANGIILARDYNEMWLKNLAAAGEAIREIFPPASGVRAPITDALPSRWRQILLRGNLPSI